MPRFAVHRSKVWDCSKSLTLVQVPLQTNFSDCGLYLVHYATQMLKQPEEMLRFIEVSIPHSLVQDTIVAKITASITSQEL